MKKFALAALVAFAPATSFAFAPMGDIGQQVRGVSSAPVLEVGGCKWKKKNCHTKNQVDIWQRNNANVDIRSKRGSRNEVYVDQYNDANVDIRGSRNEVYIQQSNDANVSIR